jgi:hypothetical protein
MVAAGAGIGYVSRLSVKQELASGQLVEIHCAKLQMKRSFSVLIPQGPDPMSERALVVRSAGVGSDVGNVHWNLEWFGFAKMRRRFLQC